MDEAAFYREITDRVYDEPIDYARAMVSCLADLLDARAVSFYLVAAPGRLLRLKAQWGLSYERFEHIELPIETSIAGLAAMSGEVQDVSDVSEARLYRDTDLISAHKLKRMLAIPCSASPIGEQVAAPDLYAVICVYPHDDVIIETERLSTICSSLADGYLRSLLHEKLRLREQLVAAAHRSADTGSLLYRANRILADAMYIDAGSIFLHEELSDLLRMRTCNPGIVTRAVNVTDVAYPVAAEKWTCRCYREGRSIMLSGPELAKAANESTTLEILPEQAVSEILVPISSTMKRVDRVSGEEVTQRRALGVIRAFNKRWRIGGCDFVGEFCWEDLFLVEFFGEMLAVLIQAHTRRDDGALFLERRLHGAKQVLMSAQSKLGMVSERLNPTALPAEMDYFVQDAVAALDDILGQIERNQLRQSKMTPRKVLLYGQVLAKLPTYIADSARMRGRGPFRVTDFADAGFRTLPAVAGDVRALSSVFRNLADNAVKYSDPEDPGEKQIEFSAKIVGEYLRVTVTDNGIGIPASQVSSIFDEGFRATNAQQHETDGLGQGLSDCREIMELLDGGISFSRNSPTTFHVFIPLWETA